MPKFKHKEMKAMLKDEILEKIFSNKEMQMIPIGCQSTAVSVFERVLIRYYATNWYMFIHSKMIATLIFRPKRLSQILCLYLAEI